MDREDRRRLLQTFGKLVYDEDDVADELEIAKIPDIVLKFHSAGYLCPHTAFRVKESVIDEMVELLADYSGASRNWNQTFYDLQRAATVDERQRFVDQILHYFTSYGLNLGETAPEYVYFPVADRTAERPVFSEDELKKIDVLSLEEFATYIQKTYVERSISLPSDTVESIAWAIKRFKLAVDFTNVRNNDLLAALVVELEPGAIRLSMDNILRVYIYHATGGLITSIIKNRAVKEHLKSFRLTPELRSKFSRMIKDVMKTRDGHVEAVHSYRRHRKLWEIVLRKLRLHGTKLYKRLQSKDIPSRELSPTEKSRIATSLTKGEVKNIARSISITDLVRMYNAFAYRSQEWYDPGQTWEVFVVRNGKEFIVPLREKFGKHFKEVLDEVIKPELQRRLRRSKYHKIFIDDVVRKYAVPISSKTDVGTAFPPNLSVLDVGSPIIIGVHWYDNSQDPERVDLDLSAYGYDPVSRQGELVSWSSVWKTQRIVFSGDVTSAPRPDGATELMYIHGDYFVGIQLHDYTRRGVEDAHLIVTEPSPELVEALELNVDRPKKKAQRLREVRVEDAALSIPFSLSPQGTKKLLIGVYAPPDKFVIYVKKVVGKHVASLEVNTIDAEIPYIVNRSVSSLKVGDLIDMMIEEDRCELVDDEESADIVLSWKNWNSADFAQLVDEWTRPT